MPSPKRKVASRPGPVDLDNRGLAIFLYGQPGCGKTSWASQWEDVGFIHDPAEPGIRDLVKYKRVRPPKRIMEVTEFEDIWGVSYDLVNEGCKTLAYDSASGFELLCFKQHCEQYFDGDWSSEGFLAFQRGPKNAAKTDWPRLLALFDEIRKQGVNIIFIGHSEVKPFSNPSGADYDKYIPVLNKETWSQTSRWAQAILFMTPNITVKKEQPNNKMAKAKVVSEQSGGLLMYTDANASYEAKNRYGLSSPIDMGESAAEGYANFMKELRQAEQGSVA